MFKDGSKFFEKGHQRNIPVKLFQNLTSSFREKDFLRISSCPFRARRPHSPKPCFWADQNFAILKRVTQGTCLWNYFKIRPEVPEEKIFKELLKKFNFVAMATRVFDGIKFCEQFLKRTSQGPSLVKTGPVVWEEMFKEIIDDAHITTLKAPLENVVLRWAKNALIKRNKRTMMVLYCSPEY